MLVLSVAAFLLEVARVGPAYHCVKLGISTVRCDAETGAQYHLHMYQAPLKQPYLMRVRSRKPSYRLRPNRAGGQPEVWKKGFHHQDM